MARLRSRKSILAKEDRSLTAIDTAVIQAAILRFDKVAGKRRGMLLARRRNVAVTAR